MRDIKTRIINWICRTCCILLDHFNEGEIEEYRMLQPGDVVWAIMPLKDTALLRVTPGHRIRPYVIKEITEKEFICYSCSSKPYNYIPMCKQYYIDKHRYKVNKSSYVDTSREWHIPHNHVQSFFYHLLPADYEDILKISQILVEKKIEQEFGIGSVIYKKSTYFLITHVINQMYSAYPLVLVKENNPNYQTLALNKKIYYINLSNRHLIDPKDNEVTVYLQISKQQVQEILRHNKREKSKVITEEKKEKLLVNIHTGYPVGTLFHARFLDQDFVYLYHNKNRAYGFYLGEGEEQHLQVCKGDVTYMQRDRKLSLDELGRILSEVVMDGNQRTIVGELLKKVWDKEQSTLSKENKIVG